MKMKQIETLAAIFLGCTLGSVILHFAAPILLAILVSGFSLWVPFLIYHLYVTKGWRIRMEREKGNDPLKGKEKTSEQNSAKVQDENNLEPEEEAAIFWYNETGRVRLNEIILRLSSRGITECWIRNDGICNYRTVKGYRRIGIIYGYPGKSPALVARLLREDGLIVMEQKHYLRISWKMEEEAA